MGAVVVCTTASVTLMDLAELTTLRLGGPAAGVIDASTQESIIEAVARADAEGARILIVGGGSNLVVADDGFDGSVLLVRSKGINSEIGASGATVTVQSGEQWDGFVSGCVAAGWSGVEALSGIPGRVGAVPIQNVGAYGQDVAGTILSVRTYDRHASKIRTFTASECAFSYRGSRFKTEPDRFVILSVTFEFGLDSLSAPIAYAELAGILGVAIGDRAPMADVREAVLALRTTKGMVLDPADHDTWSAGSFFTNPILSVEMAATLPAEAPRFAQTDGRVKTSAAWLIDHAGYGKGYGAGEARLSSKHALALTNRGGATTTELLELARDIRDGVERKFGVRLVNEPVLVNCSL